MTVIREQSEAFHAPPTKVVEAIRSALAEGHANYRYHKTVEADDHLVFNTVVRPSCWLISPTKMIISLQPADSETKVIVQTRSQWFVRGDVFNFYGRYLRNILEAIRRKLERHRC